MLLQGIKYVAKKVKNIVLMARVSVSPKIASKVAKSYWAKCDKTHGDTSWKSFEFYYNKIKEIMEPTKSDVILDAGCGEGELTYLFHKDGFDVKGFDSSDYLISKAKNRFGNNLFYVDDFVNMSNKKRKSTKIFLNSAFFYVHPKYCKTVLKNLYDITADGGRVYLFDDPDYSKRGKWYKRRNYHIQLFFNISTSLFPVSYLPSAAFWIKTKKIRKSALKVGFCKVEKLDSWNYYRTHHVLFKDEIK